MTNKDRMSFDFNVGTRAAHTARRDEDAPFRLLVVADLTGQGGAAREPLRARRPVHVDFDTFPRVFERFAPAIELGALKAGAIGVGAAGAAAGATATTTEKATFASFDDFHPDRLFARLPRFSVLRGLLGELNDPSRFGRVAAALGLEGAGAAHVAGTPPDSAASTPPASPASADADIERLLGRKPSAPANAPATSAVDALLRDVVAAHLVAPSAAQRSTLASTLHARLAALMRCTLADPAFRQLEAAWRSVERLVAALGDEPSIELCLLDATSQELFDDIRAHAGDLSGSAAWHHLANTASQADGEHPWALVAVDHAFGGGPQDLALLAALGSLTARVGAALVAGADASLLGCRRVDDLADPAAWQAPDEAIGALWQAVRSSDAAANIGLAAPGVLLRAPYGAASDPIETFPFEEADTPTDPGQYLWGGAGLALALLAGRGFAGAGWAMDPDDFLLFDDLPAFSYRDDGEAKLRACARSLVPDSAAQRMLAGGVMPLQASRSDARVRLARWQSIAQPVARLRGPWD